MKPTEKEKEEFIAVLKCFGMFEPLSQYKVICPFHGDKNPSMLINLDEASFYCFGCGVKGSTFELVKLQYPSYNTFNIVRAIKAMASGKDGENKQKTNILQIAPKVLNMQAVRDYYFNLPKVNWYSKEIDVEAKQYMKKLPRLSRSSLNFFKKNFLFESFSNRTEQFHFFFNCSTDCFETWF